MAYPITNSTRFRPQNLDAAGALMVANKSVLGNYVQNVDELPLLLHRINSGTATQSWANGVVTMNTSGTDYAICQSYKRHIYLGGKSQQMDITFSRMGIQADVIKRVGYFSSSTTAPYAANKDGFYLEMDGTTYNIVIAKGGVLTTIPRASWDDPLDGTGVSGVNLDLNLFTEMTFKFLYLGGTSLEISFNAGGVVYIAHTYKNSSVTSNTFVNSPVQPVRWEMISTGGAGTFDQVCAAVSIGGVNDLVGYPRSIDLGSSFVNADDTALNYLIAAVRLNALDEIAFEFMGECISTTNDSFIQRFILNPTIASPPTWNSLSSSGIEYALGDTVGTSSTTITGGTQLAGGYGDSSSVASLTANSLFQLGADLDGNSDVIALCVQPISSNLDIRGTVNFKTL